MNLYNEGDKMIEILKHQGDLFAGVYWALQAISKKESRQSLRHLKVEIDGKKAKFIGCDGYRLHIFRIEDFAPKPGMYSIKKATKSEIVLIRSKEEHLEYPDYNKVIPSADTVIKSVRLETAHKMDNISWGYADVVRETKREFTLNFDLYKQLTAINEDDFKIMITEGNHILLKKKGYFGILMPINSGEPRIEWTEVKDV